MYRTKVGDVTDPKQRITDAIAIIDEDMLRQTCAVLMCFVQLVVPIQRCINTRTTKVVKMTNVQFSMEISHIYSSVFYTRDTFNKIY